PTERPAQTAERQNLVLFVMLQDVAHPREGPHVPRLRQRLGGRQLMVGFQVSINCRFWVSTEGRARRTPGHSCPVVEWLDWTAPRGHKHAVFTVVEHVGR